MRICLVSNAPWTSSGYGVQTDLLMHALRKMGHDVAVVAFYGLQGAATQIGEIVVYPGGAQPFGQDVIAAHANHFRADLVVTLIDAWVYTANEFTGHRWAPWFPVDCYPLPEPIRHPVARSWQPIAMSRFGQRAAREKGLDAAYVPLAYDPDVYHPVAKAEARDAQKWPQDRWIAGMIAANAGEADRKAFVPQLAAFAEFRKRHPDALLYIHTDLTGGGRGIDLRPYVEHLGLQEERDYLALRPYASRLSVDKALMRQIFGGMDALFSVSMGEGFGVPIVEAQACGRPVITGDWTAMGEITRSGWTLPVSDTEPFWNAVGGEMRRPRVGALVDLLETAYAESAVFRPEAVSAAVAEYQIERVAADCWTPVLATMEQRVNAAPSAPVLVAGGLR